ncbi:MAG: spondin domain-containing protein [Myxococcales bacterium]|nr:spondin domain-containing protein [Myxococcales bacterium]
MHKLAVLLLIPVACAANAQRPSSKDAAVYEVKFQGVWTARNHPIDYPKGGSLSLSGAHFSGVIGAPHNGKYAIFTQGALATRGLELLSHKGSKSPLDEEIKAAQAAGNAGEIFDTGVFLDVTSPKTATFEVSDRFPLVSLVAMIAPSPDWFTGVSGLDLKEDGRWVDSKTVEAYAWDSGTFDGDTYKADEKPSTPHQPIAPSPAPPFSSRKPIAILTFTRQK